MKSDEQAGDELATMVSDFFASLGLPEMAPVFMVYLRRRGYLIINRDDVPAYIEERLKDVFKPMGGTQ